MIAKLAISWQQWQRITAFIAERDGLARANRGDFSEHSQGAFLSVALGHEFNDTVELTLSSHTNDDQHGDCDYRLLSVRYYDDSPGLKQYDVSENKDGDFNT